MVKFITVVKVGLEEDGSSSSVFIYPNPTSGRLFIGLTDAASGGPVMLTLYTLPGQEVWCRQWVAHPGQTTTFELPSLAEGLYLLRLDGPDFRRTLRLLVKH
ncbi:MAG: T9SS type A sorting domain-containing protein [Flavobacteriales bacterium]|nr:T9SS type A sorting domain-containing protein [Flavobacteriales bacterium]MCX7767668.1 T9SS type A sorting domain-containing protein [Flavobacteriales bacterium]